jgi:hypothetical protein
MAENQIELLKEGDVILLKNGNVVYTKIPEMFVYSNRKTSKKPVSDIVVIGMKYCNDTDITGNIMNVASGVVERFGYEGISLSMEDATKFVMSKIKQPKEEEFIIDEGEFVVVKTEYGGGGTGMGDRDVYPNGHRVYCRRLKEGKFDENGTEISFYQTGCFTAMITDIKPIRKLKLQFV